MLEAGRATAGGDRRLTGWARAGLRLLFGYLLAVASGVIVFMATLPLAGGTGFRPDETGLGLVSDVLMNASFYFVVGALFGLPYTVVGTTIFLRWLPKSRPVFLLVGMLCPAAAALLTMAAMNALQFVNGEFLFFMLLTLPAGLAAAYVFGAIGMGWGFGRWRFG